MVFSLISRIRSCLDPPKLPKVGSAIRIGLLGVSRITPLAILHPSNQIPNSIVYSVASRSLDKAKTFAGKYGLETFYGSYQELLDDEKVDCVFIALPNGLHYEWTLKAIKAGKHILVEKPSFSNEKEARDVFEKGREKGVLVLEAFHYRFHPALHEYACSLNDIHSSTNPIVKVESSLYIPPLGKNGPAGSENDIRFSWDLAGGSLMDTGSYVISSILYTIRSITENLPTKSQYTFSSNSTSLETSELQWSSKIKVEEGSTIIEPFEPKTKESKESKLHLDENGKNQIDLSTSTKLLIPSTSEGEEVMIPCYASTSFRCRLSFEMPVLNTIVQIPWFKTPSLKATFKDGSTVEISNFPQPTYLHRIKVVRRGESAKGSGDNKNYTAYTTPRERIVGDLKKAAKDGFWSQDVGKDYWTTYTYQLKAFTDAIQSLKDGTPLSQITFHANQPWVKNLESELFLRIIGDVYRDGGMRERRSPEMLN